MTAARAEAAGGFDGADGFACDDAPLLAGGGAVTGGFAEAGGVFSGMTGVLGDEAEEVVEPDLLVVADGGTELSALFRIIRGTISAASTSVPAAPMMKYFSEPLAARGPATRRGAAIVTFTFGNDETGMCDGALGTAAFGETGDSGTESRSTPGGGAGCATRGVAAPADDACSAATRGGCETAAVSG